MLKRLAYTAGEPAGIGPDLILQLAQKPFDAEIVVFGCPENLSRRASVLNLPITLNIVDWDSPPKTNGCGRLSVYPVPVPFPMVMGEPRIENREAVLKSLDLAFEACLTDKTHALVTGPIQKSVLLTGHTEYFTKLAGLDPNQADSMMAFYHPDCVLGLVTSHIPLKEVSETITAPYLKACILRLNDSLKDVFGIERPKIGILGLNPHAGESGHIGLEEIKVMIPVINALKKQGLDLEGPISGDTAFINKNLKHYDGLLAMYHDQGLGPLKALNFHDVVNITLGLPILRVSVDHGTALCLAGTGTNDVRNLHSAIQLALKLNPVNLYSKRACNNAYHAFEKSI